MYEESIFRRLCMLKPMNLFIILIFITLYFDYSISDGGGLSVFEYLNSSSSYKEASKEFIIFEMINYQYDMNILTKYIIDDVDKFIRTVKKTNDILQPFQEATQGAVVGSVEAAKYKKIDAKKVIFDLSRYSIKNALQLSNKIKTYYNDIILNISKGVINGIAEVSADNKYIMADLIEGATEGIVRGTIESEFFIAQTKANKVRYIGAASKKCIFITKNIIYKTNIANPESVIIASIAGVIGGAGLHKFMILNALCDIRKYFKDKTILAYINRMHDKIKNENKKISLNKEYVLEKKPPVVKIQFPIKNQMINKSLIPLSVYVECLNATDNYNNILIYINGQQVQKKQATHEHKGSTTIYNYLVNLVENKNHIKVVVSDSNNFTSYDSITVFRVPEGSLYFLSVGVNQLKKISNNNLDFATKDAIDMANLMKQMKGKLYKDVKAYVYTDESPEKPTADNIVDALYTKLGQATEDDTVMIYLAGHGVTINDNQYIFLSQDSKLIGSNNYQMSSVLKWSDINFALKNIKCTKIMILDTCFTGGVNIEPLLTETIKNKIIVFYSTSKSQRAKECQELKNGCFTHAIIQALSNEMPADKNLDNKVNITELKDFVYTQLIKTSPEQTPDISLPVGGSNFIMYVR